MAALDNYETFAFNDGRWTRTVYKRGSGPAVIIIHEIPNLHPGVVRFADRVAEAGMTVYCPSLFGTPGAEASVGAMLKQVALSICVRREFRIWAGGKSSPFVDWLRALARKAHADCGGRGVGAVGMCFTGGFAMAMMTEPAVVAPVASQPSLPFVTIGPRKEKARREFDMSDEEVEIVRRRMEEEDLSAMALRFKGDPLVPGERFEALRKAFGDRISCIELNDEDGFPMAGRPPHSVLTLSLKEDGPTKEVEEQVIRFFAERTGVSAEAT
ncbi:MAG: dienelactone hydrolase family protein [Hyphomonadaceae bacterium]